MPTLYTEILIEIIGHVPDDCAFRFLLVGSRVLYHEAILKTLKRIELRHSKSIEGFLSVLDSPLSLGKTRYLAVNTIKFRHSRLDVIQPGTQKRLAKAILRLKNLREVSVSSIEDLLHDLPVLSKALCKLVSLRSLSAEIVGSHFLHGFKNIKSPLAYISLNFFLDFHPDQFVTFYEYLPPDLYSVYHPVRLLSHMSDSLEELHICNCHTEIRMEEIDEHALSYPYIYPKMHILNLRDARKTLEFFPHMLPYVRAFPNLSKINMESSVEPGTDAHLLHQSLVNSIRAMNQSDLRRSDRSWSCLDQFIGSILDLYMAGLLCPITKVCVTSWIQAKTDLEMLVACVDSARPTHLKLKGYKRLFDQSEHVAGTPGSLVDILRRPSAGGIRSIVNDFNLNPFGDKESDPRNIDVAHQLVCPPYLPPRHR